MKKILALFLFIILTAMSLHAIKTETTKQIVLQGGYNEVLDVNVTTISSQGLSDLIGMPFNILDTYCQYNIAADNPSYGERVIAKWSILSNTNFSLSIEATPLKHVTQPQEKLLYYRLAHEFRLSYINTAGTTTDVRGFYVFEPDETALDGSGRTRAYINGSYLADANGNQKVEFTELTADYWALQGTFIGAVDDNIYFGFTENTSNYLKSNEWNDEDLPDGIYEGTVTISIEAI